MGLPSVETILDETIAENELDAYLQFNDSSNTNHRYVTGFETSDAFTFLRHDGESILVVAPLEKGLAQNKADVDTVRSTAEFIPEDIRNNREAEASVIVEFLDEYGIKQIGVSRDFDLYLAEQLESHGFHVQTISNVIMQARMRKKESELEALAAAQATTERAMACANSILSESDVRDSQLHYDGEILTAERLRVELQILLMDEGCTLDEAIVACGPSGADPHYIGSGPLKPDEPILIDIYPEHESGYWGDMSRTFVKGTPADTLIDMYQTTAEAFDAAMSILSNGAGTIGGEVHDAVCDVFEAAGYPTIREGNIDEGFLHSTGHAIGLDLHEPPRLVKDTKELEAGYVLTVEPGLYDPDHGGVRIEDMIVITENGCQKLTTGNYESIDELIVST
jgi:Xaa-Pro aminopeptidase